MSSDLAAEFAAACGAATPVDLRIQRNDGVLLAEGELDLPCALIGRDQDCEIVLADADVALKHACLQVIGGRVLVADLGSRSGLHGAAGGDGYAWLTPTGETKVGPFRIFLRSPVSVAPAPLDRLPNPLLPNPDMVRRLPRTVLRFLNGRSDRGEWPVNRLMTMVGRAETCKVSLTAADVADRHCYFVLTPSGMWVVDLLSPTGTWVNGEAVRFARLLPTDEVRVGPFLLGVGYPDGIPHMPADEAPTGFRLPSVKKAGHANGASQNGTKPTESVADLPAVVSSNPQPATPPIGPITWIAGLDPAATEVEADTTSLGEQVEALHELMLGQCRKELAVIEEQVRRLPPDRHAATRQVLARLAALNAELEALQAVLFGPTQPENARASFEHMAVLQDERHGLWQKLLRASVVVS